MSINNEIELIEIIKGKKIKEIKEIFEKKYINSKELNYFENVLKYLIRKKAPFSIIKFIIYQQQKQQKHINSTSLLLYSIDNSNFKTAKLLIEYGTPKESIIEYLNDISYNITLKKFLFAWYVKHNASLIANDDFIYLLESKDIRLITGDVLCYLLALKEIYILDDLFEYHRNHNLIRNLLFIYKNKTVLSDSDLQDMLSYNKMKINDHEKHGKKNNPLLSVLQHINNNNVYIVKLLIEYAIKNCIFLKINDCNEMGDFPLLYAIKRDNVKIVKLLIHYAKTNNIILNINCCNKRGDFPFLFAMQGNNKVMVELLISYAKENNIIFKINDCNDMGDFPLLSAVKTNNKEMVKLLMNYASENGIILRINNNNVMNECPLLSAIQLYNTDIIELLIDYGEKNDITLIFNFTFNETLMRVVKKNYTHIIYSLISTYKKQILKEFNKDPYLVCVPTLFPLNLIDLMTYANDHKLYYMLDILRSCPSKYYLEEIQQSYI